MKKILLTGLGDRLGGTESFLRVLIQGLRDDYDFSILAATTKPYALKAFLDRNNVSVYQLDNIFGLKHVLTRQKTLEAFFTAHHFDIVHVNANTLNATYIARAAEKSGAKVVFQIHNAQASGYSRLARILTVLNRPRQRAYLSKSSSTLLSVSQDAALSVYGEKLSTQRAKVVVNGVDTKFLRFSDENRKQLRRELNISQGSKVAMMVARLMPIKNIPRALDLFKEASQLDDFVIVGDGPERANLEAYAVQLGAETSNRVHFLGERTDTPALFSAADVLFSTSIAEGLSISVIEAEASGLPVLASTGVPAITNITGHVTFTPLSSSNQEWLKALGKIDLNLNLEKRLLDNKMVEESEFSMSSFIATMRAVYENDSKR